MGYKKGDVVVVTAPNFAVVDGRTGTVKDVVELIGMYTEYLVDVDVGKPLPATLTFYEDELSKAGA